MEEAPVTIGKCNGGAWLERDPKPGQNCNEKPEIFPTDSQLKQKQYA